MATASDLFSSLSFPALAYLPVFPLSMNTEEAIKKSAYLSVYLCVCVCVCVRWRTETRGEEKEQQQVTPKRKRHQ
jgi:hypothetical protein